MKRSLILLVLPMLFCAIGNAEARKPCEELKQEIAAKIDAKGVKSYSLEIVAVDAVATGKVVGSCDGGSKQIVYLRTDAPAVTATAVAKLG